MFSVTTVSSPSTARYPRDPMWSTDLPSLTRYDEDLVKPAILFADRIDLRSDRLDMAAMVKSDAMKYRSMPMRSLWAYIGICYRRDRTELEMIGVAEGQLASRDEVDAFMEAASTSEPHLEEFWARHETQISEVAHALFELCRTRYTALSSPALDRLVEAGMLTVSGWSAGDDDPWTLAWTDDDEFLARIIDDLLANMNSWGDAVLIESGSRFLLPAGRLPALPATPTPEDIASSLVARIPGLREITIDELVEIRSDLDDYLAAFRAEVITMSKDLAAEQHGGSLEPVDVIDRAWHANVSPILKDLDTKVKRGSYPRQLLGAFAEDIGTQAASGASVLFAAGSALAGVGTLLPAAAAASVPFLRALNSRLKARDDLRDHRLFFLYEANRRIGEGSRRR
ncbi:MAG: hypothetical protein HGA44_01890 [Cellulomonadaceae bacterium]|nr:hypothetical protein [Cellulomonadaceae bacterium]